MAPSKKERTPLSEKAKLAFPVGRVGSSLRKGRYAKRVSTPAAVFLTAVLQYATTELLELSQTTAAQKGRCTIKPRHICVAVREDPDLNELLQKVTIAGGGVVDKKIHPAIAENAKYKHKSKSKKSADGKKKKKGSKKPKKDNKKKSKSS
eukprot:TRINITY_DN20645_c0_g1_i1.p1 TRINITY_DN20645_c0_g1~~TRINITY_DN20645_c0_g1_i1.p1  ORF type:complete len:150 (-),score=33.98 TRINITY_DN20645_c0_g1_i1:40-489(-)